MSQMFCCGIFLFWFFNALRVMMMMMMIFLLEQICNSDGLQVYKASAQMGRNILSYEKREGVSRVY